MNCSFKNYQPLFNLKKFDLKILKVKSLALENNYLKDNPERINIILWPKDIEFKAGSFNNMVMYLCGFANNSTFSVNLKKFDLNPIQKIDNLVFNNEAPCIPYIFLDAWTPLGGSQFINSEYSGNFEYYIVDEVYAFLKDNLDITEIYPLGGSSGGYGALHLMSKFPEIFNLGMSLAPDSFFEGQLLPDMLAVGKYIKEFGSLDKTHKAFINNEFPKGKDYFKLLNVLAMAFCYSPKSELGPVMPIDLKTGIINETIWAEYKKNDPVNFLVSRKENLKKLKGLFLEVGNKDEFYLYYGARQIKTVLDKSVENFYFNEFNGGHFKLSNRHSLALSWLKKQL